jgi:hypothetical protein
MLYLRDVLTLLIWVRTVPAISQEKDEVNIMHRTQSVDFGVVLSGTITLVLDDGSETVMKAGEICIQRGTNHVRLPLHSWQASSKGCE